MTELNNFWEKALSDIELQLSRPNFATWFKNSQLVKKEEGVAVVSLSNNFVKSWVEKNYNKLVLGAIRSLDESIKKVEFVIALKDNPKKVLTNTSSVNIQDSPQLTFNEFEVDPETNLNPQYSLNSFVVGSSNEMAYTAVTAVVKSLGNKYNPLFIYGGVGVGKTHLIQAIGNEIKQRYQGKVCVRYVPSEKFTNDVIWAMKSHRMETVKAKYRDIDVLIIDDIQFIGGKTRTEEEFFHTFNALKEQNKQIVISSDKPPSSIPVLEERLRSRFEAGMIIDIGYPDFELKVAVLKTKLERRKTNLSEEVINYIASKTQKNLRELEGILNKVLFYRDVKQIEITIKFVDQIVNNIIKQTYKNTNPNQIIKCVADYFEITLTDLVSKSRRREFVEPRQISMYLLRNLLNLSYPFIANKLGKQDHTTAIYAFEKIKQNIQNDSRLNQKILLIKELIDGE